MASRNRTSRWSGLRPWQILQPRVAGNNARRNPVEIWSLLEELMGEGPYRVTRLGDPGSQIRLMLDEDEDLWGNEGAMEARLRDLVASRSLEMDESQGRPIDTRAVLAKCRTEAYKPKSRGCAAGRPATTMATQEDCPVCLEKFVTDQVLYRIPCNHLFHKDCLTPWIQSNHGDCPCCRAQILASPTSVTAANNSRRDLPSRSSGNNRNANAASNSGRNARRENDDIMSVLSAMEAAMESLGFRTY